MKILLLAILIRLFSNPTANVLQKKLTQNHSSFMVNTITYLGLTLLISPLLFQSGFWELHTKVWIYGALGGLLGALGNAALVKALSLGDLSVLGPINAYKSVVSLFFGIILLKELPSASGIAAIFLIILGSYFVFDSVDEKFSIKLFKRPDILYRILALILTAIEAVVIKKVITLSSISTSFVFWCLFGFIFSFCFAAIKREKLPVFSLNNSLEFAGLITLFGLMQYSTNYVFNNMNTAYALAIFQLSSIIAVFFGYKFFKEKHIAKKLLGTTIMILGAVIIILS